MVTYQNVFLVLEKSLGIFRTNNVFHSWTALFLKLELVISLLMLLFIMRIINFKMRIQFEIDQIRLKLF